MTGRLCSLFISFHIARGFPGISISGGTLLMRNLDNTVSTLDMVRNIFFIGVSVVKLNKR